jgi:hypothetical protein
VERSPELRARYGAAWDSITAIQAARRQVAPGILYGGYLNYGPLGQSVALARAVANPNAAALRTAALASTDRSPAEQEIELAALLAVAQRRMPNDTILRTVLAGRTPEQAARAIVAGYTLQDTAARRQLLAGGADAVAASADPTLRLARTIAPLQAERQARWQALADRERVRRGELGRAFFEVYGTAVPPDATFTLRLADGVVKGYEADGMTHAPFTTYHGLYNRAAGFGGREPFNLPPRWRTVPAGLDLATPFNFTSTNDIIGGNSGSPVVNRDLEVVGLAFDGNLQSLPGSFIFDETQNRTISVHSAGMLEALRDVYRATRIVNELTRR